MASSEDTVERLNAALADRYRVEGEIGSGGMATVYLAEDLKHHRKVAVKVLQPELSAVVGTDRFLSEIETTANLQHPNILPLFDSGEADGLLFYVMPFVEGESLRERLDREKELPIDEAVRIVTDVAEALHAAHEQGVIHRDIKPANILLSSGKPLVADFGIALAVSAAGGGRLTETGLSLGTPYYMSPEQASADRDPNKASDIYSLGCVLFEMLVGEPPFTGATAQAVFAKVLTEEPRRATEYRKTIPGNVDAAVRRALEKLPADRFASAQDFGRALSDSGFRHGEPAVVFGAEKVNRWKRAAIAFGFSALVIGAGFAWFLTRPEPPGPVLRLRTDRLAENHLTGGEFHLGPAGTGFVFLGTDGQMWYRGWDDLEAEPVAGTTKPAGHSMSPNGTALAQQLGGELRVFPLPGGGGRVVADSMFGSRGWISPPTWGDDGYLYYAGRDSTTHRVLASGGGSVERLNIEREEGELRHHGFRLLPGGEKAIFRSFTSDATYHTIGIDLGTGRRVVLLRQGSSEFVLPTGHRLYRESDRLMAVAMDLNT
ncbi:MAG: serine/threonine protein kinase, partial [Longimicrobiales bacterium]|nr:serine/threonine protein kinase [Longimicrobiales bacterium]